MTEAEAEAERKYGLTCRNIYNAGLRADQSTVLQTATAPGMLSVRRIDVTAD